MNFSPLYPSNPSLHTTIKNKNYYNNSNYGILTKNIEKILQKIQQQEFEMVTQVYRESLSNKANDFDQFCITAGSLTKILQKKPPAVDMDELSFIQSCVNCMKENKQFKKSERIHFIGKELNRIENNVRNNKWCSPKTPNDPSDLVNTAICRAAKQVALKDLNNLKTKGIAISILGMGIVTCGIVSLKFALKERREESLMVFDI